MRPSAGSSETSVSVYIWFPIYWLFGIFLWNCYPVHVFPVFLLPLPGRKNLQNQIQYRIWQALPVKPIFRSTLPRRERQFNFARGSKSPFISILAPTKGATHSWAKQSWQLEISILAPAKGATEAIKKKDLYRTFQFTLPWRERPSMTSPLLPFHWFQSALPRGERP